MAEFLFVLAFTLVVWIPIGALIGSVARGRAFAGGVLGFLLGPIGWAIVFALADHRRFCPQCRGPIRLTVTKCLHCGSSVPPYRPTRDKNLSGVTVLLSLAGVVAVVVLLAYVSGIFRPID